MAGYAASASSAASASTLLVGQERAASIEDVADPSPLKRCQLTAEHAGHLWDRISMLRARPANRLGRVPSLVEQLVEHLARRMCDLNLVAGDERLECFGEPRIQRDGSSALRAWQTLEGRADVGIPNDLEA
jgi:hypothetical protein